MMGMMDFLQCTPPIVTAKQAVTYIQDFHLMQEFSPPIKATFPSPLLRVLQRATPEFFNEDRRAGGRIRSFKSSNTARSNYLFYYPSYPALLKPVSCVHHFDTANRQCVASGGWQVPRRRSASYGGHAREHFEH